MLTMSITTKDLEDKASAPNFLTSPIEYIEHASAMAVEQTIIFMATLWDRIPTPRLSAELFDSFTGSLAPYLVGFTTLTIIYLCIKLVFAQDSAPARRIAAALPVMSFTIAAVVPVVSLLAALSDAMSKDILDWGTDGGNLGENLMNLFGMGNGGDFVLSFLLGLLIAFSVAPLALFIAGFMIIRWIGIIFFSLALIFASTVYGTESGRQWYNTCLQWIIGLLIFKPVTATLFAVSFWFMSGTGSSGFLPDAPEFVQVLFDTTIGLAALGFVVVAFWKLMSVAPIVAQSVGEHTSHRGGGGHYTVQAEGASSNGDHTSKAESMSTDAAPVGSIGDGGSFKAMTVDGAATTSTTTGAAGATAIATEKVARTVSETTDQPSGSAK